MLHYNVIRAIYSCNKKFCLLISFPLNNIYLIWGECYKSSRYYVYRRNITTFLNIPLTVIMISRIPVPSNVKTELAREYYSNIETNYCWRLMPIVYFIRIAFWVHFTGIFSLLLNVRRGECLKGMYCKGILFIRTVL